LEIIVGKEIGMKVLHINSYYSGSSFYKNLYDKQIEYGLDLDVFVPVPLSFDSSDLMLGDYTKISANHRKYDRILFYLKHNKIYKAIRKAYKVNDYAILHAHSLFSNGYIALKLKKDYGVPYVVAVRNTDVNTFFKYMLNLRKLGVKILKEADRIIFLSESYKNIVIGNYVPIELRKEILNKVEIIPNGIDEFWFRNKGVPKTLEANLEIRLLYVGIINKNKNIISTTKAIEFLLKKGYKVRLTLVGKIGDEEVYQKVKDLPYIHYMGPKSKDDLLKIYNENHILIMPSKTETFGLVYAEAISQGLPVIYSKGQGFDKQFEEGLVGYHVNSNNAEDIAGRILDVISNYRHISENCIEQCEKFDWSVISNNYLDIYRDIMIKRD
jgi:glycosyltransferase involved in cell wall biosynthesis